MLSAVIILYQGFIVKIIDKEYTNFNIVSNYKILNWKWEEISCFNQNKENCVTKFKAEFYKMMLKNKKELLNFLEYCNNIKKYIN